MDKWLNSKLHHFEQIFLSLIYCSLNSYLDWVVSFLSLIWNKIKNDMEEMLLSSGYHHLQTNLSFATSTAGKILPRALLRQINCQGQIVEPLHYATCSHDSNYNSELRQIRSKFNPLLAAQFKCKLDTTLANGNHVIGVGLVICFWFPCIMFNLAMIIKYISLWWSVSTINGEIFRN